MSKNPKKRQIRNSTAEFLIFANQARGDGIEVRFERETIWLTQRLMANLFDCSTDNISLHLKNIFAEKELDEKSVAEDFSATAADGKNYLTKHYNLDAILSTLAQKGMLESQGEKKTRKYCLKVAPLNFSTPQSIYPKRQPQ